MFVITINTKWIGLIFTNCWEFYHKILRFFMTNLQKKFYISNIWDWSWFNKRVSFNFANLALLLYNHFIYVLKSLRHSITKFWYYNSAMLICSHLLSFLKSLHHGINKFYKLYFKLILSTQQKKSSFRLNFSK